MTVVARNYSPPGGKSEADLIAWDAGELVIIEVKTRASAEFGPPERAVGYEKHQKMISAGEHYARRAEVPLDRIRFDVLSILIIGNTVEVEHFKAAVKPGRWRAASA
jgi:putative endonuclease